MKRQLPEPTSSPRARQPGDDGSKRPIFVSVRTSLTGDPITSLSIKAVRAVNAPVYVERLKERLLELFPRVTCKFFIGQRLLSSSMLCQLHADTDIQVLRLATDSALAIRASLQRLLARLLKNSVDETSRQLVVLYDILEDDDLDGTSLAFSRVSCFVRGTSRPGIVRHDAFHELRNPLALLLLFQVFARAAASDDGLASWPLTLHQQDLCQVDLVYCRAFVASFLGARLVGTGFVRTWLRDNRCDLDLPVEHLELILQEARGVACSDGVGHARSSR